MKKCKRLRGIKKRARRPLGFSLLEVMISMAIGGVIISAAASSVSLVNQHIYYIVKSTIIDDDVKHVEEYLAAQIQEAGGGLVKAGQAIRVYQGVSAADTLVVADFDSDLNVECQIKSLNVISKTVEVEREDTNNDGHLDYCCLSAIPLQSELMLLPAAGRATSSILTNSDTTGSECKITGLSWSPLDVGHFTEVATDFSSSTYIGGTITVVKRVRFQVDSSSKLLKTSWLEEGVLKSQTITDRVFDFQVALGYDAKESDGKLFDNGSINDEWVGNNLGDSMALIGTGAADEDLRLVSVAVALSASHLGKSEQVQLLDGPLIAPGNAIVRQGKTTVSVRNTNTFE